MKKKLTALLAGIMALTMLLTACGSSKSGSDNSADNSSNAAESRTLTIGLAADPQTMDPQALLSGATTAVVCNL